jgi:hypothetical protein
MSVHHVVSIIAPGLPPLYDWLKEALGSNGEYTNPPQLAEGDLASPPASLFLIAGNRTDSSLYVCKLLEQARAAKLNPEQCLVLNAPWGKGGPTVSYPGDFKPVIAPMPDSAEAMKTLLHNKFTYLFT